MAVLQFLVAGPFAKKRGNGSMCGNISFHTSIQADSFALQFSAQLTKSFHSLNQTTGSPMHSWCNPTNQDIMGMNPRVMMVWLPINDPFEHANMIS